MKKTLALLLALTLALPFASCTGSVDEQLPEGTETENTETENTDAENENTEDEVKVMTYAEYDAAELDTPVVIETYVQAKQAWWEDKATVYTQDKDGAYFLYELACSEADYEKLVPGTKIRVTGYKGAWAGEVEVMDGTFEILDGDTFIAEAMDVTELLGTDELIKHQNKFVSFKGLTIEASTDADGNEAVFLYNWDGSGQEGNDLYFNVSDGKNKYTFTVESYLCGSDTDVYKAVKELKVGDKVDMEGYLYWYEGVNPHITAVTVVE